MSSGNDSSSGMFSLIALVLIVLLSFFSENTRATYWGGTMVVDLPPGQKLVGAPDWRFSNFWYATRDMEKGEKAKTYTFNEDSVWGIFKGKVMVVEHEATAAELEK